MKFLARIAARFVAHVTIAALIVASGQKAAWSQGAEIAVDIELVLAVDISFSMDLEEQRIQRKGYAAAFRHPDVVKAIVEGGWGKIAVTYIEWAGDRTHIVSVPWTLIDSREASFALADRLELLVPRQARFTSIASIIDNATNVFDGNGFKGLRRVIDVSGDGPNNIGRTVTHARDDAVARGVIINGLPLMTAKNRVSPLSIPDLDEYFLKCVVGGTGSFSIPVFSWEEFPEAVRRKLVLEISLSDPDLLTPYATRPLPAQAQGVAEVYDCLIGEKLLQKWLRRGG